MEYGLEWITLHDRGERLRAEAMLPQVVGAGREVERINAFYREAGQIWLGRVMAMRLPEGRFAASLSAEAALAGERLTVELCWRLSRRGRVLDEGRTRQVWAVRRGQMLPPIRKKGKISP